MHLGALLVLVGTILCALAIVLDRHPARLASPGLLIAVGATLIGIGVLVGGTTLVTT